MDIRIGFHVKRPQHQPGQATSPSSLLSYNNHSAQLTSEPTGRFYFYTFPLLQVSRNSHHNIYAGPTALDTLLALTSKRSIKVSCNLCQSLVETKHQCYSNCLFLSRLSLSSLWTSVTVCNAAALNVSFCAMDKWFPNKSTMTQYAGTEVENERTAADETVNQRKTITKKCLQQQVPSNQNEEKCWECRISTT